jgi:hypothetical protein
MAEGLASRFVTFAGFLLVVLAAGPGRAEDKATESGKPAAKRLCDETWDGGFWTIEVDQTKNDGKTSTSKPYDPGKPSEPWLAPEGQYTRMGYYQDPDRRNKGLPPNQIVKMIGRFYDKKKAEEFLKRMYSNSDFARHLNPRYPPFVSAPGALLVSDKYTCTLNKENDTLSKANWIVEVDGHLFAGAESRCKDGKKKKTVAVVDCAGSKTMVTDTIEVSCGANVHSCLYPLPADAFAVDHDYTLGGEGTTVAIRAYDLKKKQQVFSAEETNDGDADTAVILVDDVDGDGIPEIVHRVAGTGEIVSKLKWRNRRFVKVGR